MTPLRVLIAALLAIAVTCAAAVLYTVAPSGGASEPKPPEDTPFTSHRFEDGTHYYRFHPEGNRPEDRDPTVTCFIYQSSISCLKI